jgi:hypothetical protein
VQDLRWEYLEIYIAGHDWADSTGATGELPVVTLAGYSHVNSNELLDDLGSVGWELIGAVAGQMSGTYKLFLKRQLDEDEDEE